MPGVTDHTATLGDQPVFWRAGEDGRPPVLYLHGVPSSSDQWVALLERTGGLAPDLPGFGRTGKRGDLDFSIDGMAAFVDRFLDMAGEERVRLVVHDWGAAGLVWAQREPERVERLVVLNAVPLLPGYRWHRIARLWRTPVVGELTMGFTTRRGFKQLSREALVAEGPAPDELIDRVWDHFDHGTQRAILKLFRAERAPTAPLDAVTAPALVVWGERDPYLAPEWSERVATALGGPARVEIVPGAGHWPWMQRPQILQEVARFLGVVR